MTKVAPSKTKVKNHRQSVSITGGSLSRSLLKADKSRASKVTGDILAFESPDNKAKLARQRQTVAVTKDQQVEIIEKVTSNSNTRVRKSIANAGKAFELNDGTQAGDLVIENDRLKTTIQILN